MTPRPLRELPADALHRLRFVLTDIDDTLTSDGRLGSAAYAALEHLQASGLEVIPITGRPAGWCDLIARLWPVSAIVGENGAFYMRYDRVARTMQRRYWQTTREREAARGRLHALAEAVLHAVPGSALASDQQYRACDLAIDVAEDVPPLAEAEIDRLAGLLTAAGAVARISSIHVNAWFGSWDKLAMTRILLREQYDVDLDADRGQAVFAGDSPNDAPMFAHFPNAVGVANVARFLARMPAPPAYIADGEGGAGFVELAEAILAARASGPSVPV